MQTGDAQEVIDEIKKLYAGNYIINDNEELTEMVSKRTKALTENMKDISYGQMTYGNNNGTSSEFKQIQSEHSKLCQENRVDFSDRLNEINSHATTNHIDKSTRFYYLKKIVEKAIRPFTRNQVDFNFRSINLIKYVFESMHYITGLNEEYVSILNVQAQEISELKNQNEQFMNEINNLKSHIGIQDSASTRIDELFTRSDNVFEKCDNTNKWNELLDARIKALETYTTGLRSEVFFELDRAKKYANVNDTKIDVKLNKSYFKKLEDMQGNIAINIGSGTNGEDQYINVDIRDIENVDVVADIRELPFENNSIAEISARHVIEHFTNAELENSILPRLYEKLKIGGELVVTVPNIELMALEFAKSNISFEDFQEVVLGGQDYDENYHYSMFSETFLHDMLKKVGFSKIEVVYTDKKNGLCIEMQMKGIK